MDTSGAGSTFLKVDEVGENPAPADSLGPSPQNVADDEFWVAESGQPTQPVEASTDNVSDMPPRPGLRRDQWVPPPQQPAPPPPDVVEEPDATTDSISLAQLRRIVMDQPKKEPTPYAFEYADVSSFEEELEEMFGYGVTERETLLQLPLVYEHNCKAFYKHAMSDNLAGGAPQEHDVDAQHINFLRAGLNSKENSHKVESLQVLLYIALGCWKDIATQQEPNDTQTQDTASFEESVDGRYTKRSVQVRKIKSNLGLISRLIGFETIFQVFKLACLVDGKEPSVTPDAAGSPVFDRESLVDANSEYWASIKLLILLVDFAQRCSNTAENEIFRKAAEDSSGELLQFLTHLLAEWRWDEGALIPPMNLLSLYWKTVLLAFGGLRDIQEIKEKMTGDQAGLKDASQPLITASPLDYHLFRQEITSKYPAFTPPPPLFPFEPDSNSIFPPAQEQIHKIASESKLASSVPGGINATGSSIIHQPVHISTPAPSPPPSPAGPGGKGIKKQNYQTNQMFPFLYPPLEESSNAIGGKGSTELQDALAGRKWTGSDIPASILEAADLFAHRMRATRAMKQLWDERVRFMKYERGYDPLKLPPAATETAEEKPDPKEEDDMMLKSLSADQRARLDRVETFYGKEAPNFQSLVIVLLKALVQSVTAHAMPANLQNGVQGGAEQPQHPPNGDSTNEIEPESGSIIQSLDVMRGQEIMGKALSGILLLLLKWFKLSHVLKFEYLTQLLLDSNYAHLILKMSTLQELERVVNFKCERKSLNFFEFCHRHALGSRISTSDEEEENDADEAAPPPIRTHRNTNGGDSLEDVPASVTRAHPPETNELGGGSGLAPDAGNAETITEFSWRNFFSNINHLRILQKIVKNKAHRQLMMVQYKFSNVLKKALKVPQPAIRLYTLKIIKGQVPYCHRKWRQSNMRIITAIYLHCKPELRDDWLAGLALDDEMSDALPQESALRSLTYWYNLRRYPGCMGADAERARGLMEEETDFFVRELEGMEAAFGGFAFRPEDGLDGDDGLLPEFAARPDGLVEAW